MIEFLGFISYIIQLYIYIIVAGVVLSWLIAFGLVNGHNSFVRALYEALHAVTEPLLRPIRNVMPDLGSVDISPVILILGCIFMQDVVIPNLAKAVAS
jgi:YggT family protein